MEVLSPKPGNVSPASEFHDATVADFLKSAAAIAPEMALAETRPLGETILQAVQATRSVVGHNTNLGIILLIAPLAAVPPEQSLFDGVTEILRRTTVDDSQSVYRAIRLAQPAGLGEVEDQDLQSEPSLTLQECMRLAADRDLIAAQYANGFQQVLNCGLEWLREAASISHSQQQQIVWLAVRIMSEFGDSLIARKCGEEVSHAVREKAKSLLQTGWPAKGDSADSLMELDAFLRADGNRRNPGTTADLVAAILFAALREGWFSPDDSWPAC
jgi:triphosphoribosyl-dephospho-CoA synthase